MTIAILEVFQYYPALFYSALALLGLLIGSFLNVVIYRLPIMMENDWRLQCAELLGQTPRPVTPAFNLVIPASRCPICQHPVRYWENIPILSYLFLKGKCSHCHTLISWRYPFIELLTALLSTAVAWRYGVSLTTLAGLILTWALIALTFIDFDKQWLPDDIILPILWLGLLLNATPYGFTSLTASVVGAAAGYVSLWSVYWLYKLLTHKEGMGYGDFKLLALLGAWFGWAYLPAIILLSSVAGSVVGISLIIFGRHHHQIPIPFGPYLAAAGWLILIANKTLHQSYVYWLGLPLPH